MKKRRAVLIIVLVAVIAGSFAWRPAAHLVRTARHDRDTLTPPPPGMIDDASRMSRTAIAEVVSLSELAGETAAAGRQVAQLIDRARRQGLGISIAGARHTMGGHTIEPRGIVLDMRGFNGMELGETTGILRVQAGALWSEVIEYLDARGRSVAVMQSNDAFTVGGSVSANCHGWQCNRPPIASTVESFLLVRASAAAVRCSRGENADLFGLALGGYGLFGVILEVDLRVVPNERYRIERHLVDATDFARRFREVALDPPDAAMAFGRLSVSREALLTAAIITVFLDDVDSGGELPPFEDPGLRGIKRMIFRGSEGSEYGKELRWDLERSLGQHLGASRFSRNQLLHEPVDYLSHADEATDILQEYFLPPDRFAGFLGEAASIIAGHGGDLLNATVRHVLPDPDTFLRYAESEMLAVVMLFSQRRTAEADASMQSMTRDLIDAALGAGGRFYLPYRLHATAEQLHASYPQARSFFELKRLEDPDEVFRNLFYRRYGAPPVPVTPRARSSP